MLDSLKLLDRILRGEVTRPSQLDDGKLTFPIAGVSAVGIVLAMIYGACMGVYSILRTYEIVQFQGDYRQIIASTVKTPALFFLTLVVTFPSLYVFNALVGSRLQFGSVLRLLLAALGVNLAVLASFGPIVAFFSLSTNSYGFMVLLNVAMFAVAGLLGLMFLMQTLNRLQHSQNALDMPKPTMTLAPSSTTEAPRPTTDSPAVTDPTATDPTAASPNVASPTAELPDRVAALKLPMLTRPARPGAIDPIEGQAYGFNVRLVFGIWICVFGVVGAQMGWILRPFIGSPGQEFTWFRERDSNFFQAVSTTALDTVFGGTASPQREQDRRGDLRSERGQ